jgi:predicted Zn finger-like uncharacterized protein
MKISCQSCGAKYNIADEKVRGKIVKIACKKCGARIEIDGREPSEQTTDHDETRVYEAGQLPTGTTVVAESWTVSVDDNDQREISTQQLLELYGMGTVTGETFVWREGMADWQPLRDVDALRDALAAAAAGGGGVAAAPYQSEPAAPAYGNGYGAHEEPAPAAAPAPMMGGGGFGGGVEPSAARLGDARRGGAVDLFASPGAAHEDEDVATSAPQGGGMGFAAAGGLAPVAADGRPIGARNENSVLFSLSALTSSGPSTSASAAALDDEKSGLIDIQKLASAARPNGGDNRAQLDDIMNLGGGGAFGSALGAPILAPPPETALTAPVEQEKKKGNGALLAIVAVFGAAIIALLVVLILKKPEEAAKGKDAKDDDKGLKTEATEKPAKPKPTATDTGDVVPTPQPTTSATGSTSVAAKPTTTIKAPTTGAVNTAPKPPTTSTGAAPPPTTAAPPPTSTKPKCKTLDECMGVH